jgi:hypothetical protein
MVEGRINDVWLRLVRIVVRCRFVGRSMVRLVAWLGDMLRLGRVASISGSISGERRVQKSESRNSPKECGVHCNAYRMRELVERKLLTR